MRRQSEAPLRRQPSHWPRRCLHRRSAPPALPRRRHCPSAAKSSAADDCGDQPLSVWYLPAESLRHRDVGYKSNLTCEGRGLEVYRIRRNRIGLLGLVCVTNVVRFVSTAEQRALLQLSVKQKDSKMIHRQEKILREQVALPVLKFSTVL